VDEIVPEPPGGAQADQRDMAEGRVQSADGDTVRMQILKELEQRRAGRSSS